MDDGSPCRKGGAKVLAYFVSDAGGRIDNPDLQVSTRDNIDGSYLVTFEVNKAHTRLPLSPTFQPSTFLDHCSHSFILVFLVGIPERRLPAAGGDGGHANPGQPL
jgi:hypothetical protein